MAKGKREARVGQKTESLESVSPGGEALERPRARRSARAAKRLARTEETEESSQDDGDEIELRAKTKEQIRTQADGSGDDDAESESDDAEVSLQEQQTVKASFGIFDPHEEAQDAIFFLLRQSRLDAHMKLPGSSLRPLAEAVANQGNVGSLLKAVDDEDDENAEESSNAGSNGADGRDSSVVGFLSILSLQQYPKATDVFRDAMLRIASQHAPADQKAKLDEVLCPAVGLSVKGDQNASDGGATSGVSRKGKPINCGWLLKERLSNTPPQLVPRMFSSLLEDIEWSMATEEMDEEERPFYAYTHVVTLCRIYKDSEATCSSSTQSCKKIKNDGPLGFKPFFLHQEDEELLRSATVFFSWPTGSSVRVSVIKDEEAAKAAGQLRKESQPAAVMPACQIRSCPEYLLFLLLPFDKLKKCAEAISERPDMQLPD